MKDVIAIRKGGCYIVRSLVDQSARMLGTRVNEPTILTVGEMSTFRQNAETDARWMEAIDRPWSQTE
jgi:hypothetical protein